MPREFSNRTVVIRKALRESKGKLTFAQAVEQGVFSADLGVTQKNFDATKFNWVQDRKKKGKARRQEKVAAQNEPRRRKADRPAVAAEATVFTQTDFAEAIKVVQKAGGPDAVKEQIAVLGRHLAAFESIASLSAALAG